MGTRNLTNRNDMIKDIYKQVEKNIDNLADGGVGFSIPVTHEEIEEYKITREKDFMPPCD